MTASILRSRPRRARKPSHVLVDFAAELRRHPGQWHRWPYPIAPCTAERVGGLIARGNYASLPPGEFEGRMRFGVAYARFLGGAS